MSTCRWQHERLGPLDPRGLGCIGRWSSPEAKRWTEALLRDAQSDGSTLAIVAVGSAARTASYAADLDLVLVGDSQKPVLQPPPIDVDLRCFVHSDVPQLAAEGNELLGWAVLYGCPMFDRDSYWREICLRLRPEIPLPSTEEARQRAHRAHEHWSYLDQIGDKDAADEQHLAYLTHSAREALIEATVYPASRPELPKQLESIGRRDLATELLHHLKQREIAASGPA